MSEHCLARPRVTSYGAAIREGGVFPDGAIGTLVNGVSSSGYP